MTYSTEKTLIEVAEAGTMPTPDLNKLIAEIWADLLKDPDTRASIEKELDGLELSPEKPPVFVQNKTSGSLAATVGVYLALAFAEKLLDRAFDGVLDRSQAKVLKVWQSHIRPRLLRADRDSIGSKMDDEV